MVFRPEPGEPIVIPERLVGHLLRVVEAARAMRNSAVTLSINVLMDGLEESRPQPTRAGCANATMLGVESTLEAQDLVTVTEAAGLLGCTPQAVRKACGGPRLPAQKIAGVWMIRRTDLDAYRFRRNDHDHDSR